MKLCLRLSPVSAPLSLLPEGLSFNRTPAMGSATDPSDSRAIKAGSASATGDWVLMDHVTGISVVAASDPPAGQCSAYGEPVTGQHHNPLGFGEDRQPVHSDLEDDLMKEGAPPASPKAVSRAARKRAQATADMEMTSSKQFPGLGIKRNPARNQNPKSYRNLLPVSYCSQTVSCSF